MSGLDTSQPIIDRASLHANEYHVHSHGEHDVGASADEKSDDTKEVAVVPDDI